MMKRPHNVYYWIQRFDYYWWSAKEKRWGLIGEDEPNQLKPPYSNVRRLYTKKAAVQAIMNCPKGSVLTKVFWKHGKRWMIDYIRN